MNILIKHNFFGKDFNLNFKRWFVKSFGFEFVENNKLNNKKFFSLNQIHSDKIFLILKEENNLDLAKKIDGDSIITNSKNLLIASKTADCAPILFSYENKDDIFIGAIHSGHQGSFLNITNKTILKLSQITNNFDISKIKIYIGPYIFGESYEVDLDFYEKWIQKDHRNSSFFMKSPTSTKEKYYFDNGLYIKAQLLLIGVPEENIIMTKINTFSNLEFYSHRRKDRSLNEYDNLGIIGIFDNKSI